MQEHLINAPSALDQLVSELNHSGKAQYVGLLFPITTRLQVDLYGMVEALTHHAGTSRNKIMNQVVEVGIQAILDALPEDLALQLQQRAAEAASLACEKNAGNLERGEI